MRWIIPFVALALPAAAAAETVATQPKGERVDLFGRVLAFRLPAGFTQANNKNNGTNVLIEYVPKGQTVANWTRLVTIQAYRGLGTSPEPTRQIARRAFYPAACKVGPLYADGGEQVFAAGVKRSVVSNGCASLPEGAYPKALKGAGEQDFIYIFRDADTIYTLNYAERGPSFAGKAPPHPPANAAKILSDIFGTVSLQPSAKR